MTPLSFFSIWEYLHVIETILINTSAYEQRAYRWLRIVKKEGTKSLDTVSLISVLGGYSPLLYVIYLYANEPVSVLTLSFLVDRIFLKFVFTVTFIGDRNGMFPL